MTLRFKERVRIRHTIRKLLNLRVTGRSICPSDAARVLYPSDEWREQMSAIREVAAEMIAEGELEITQKGEVVDPLHARGPIRLRFVISDTH